MRWPICSHFGKVLQDGQKAVLTPISSNNAYQVTVARLEGLEDTGSDLAGGSLPSSVSAQAGIRQALAWKTIEKRGYLVDLRDLLAGVERVLLSQRHGDDLMFGQVRRSRSEVWLASRVITKERKENTSAPWGSRARYTWVEGPLEPEERVSRCCCPSCAAPHAPG